MDFFEHSGVPVGLQRTEKGVWIKLSQIDVSDLGEPFLMESVERQARRTSQKLWIGREELAADFEVRSVAGLIFHIGRCGSTLLAHSLKGRATVFSEPDVLANLFKSPLGSWTSFELARVTSIILGFFARSSPRPAVVKLTSWHTLYCPEFMAAAPGVPTVFLTRHPGYVATSLVQRSPGWARHWLGIQAENGPTSSTAQAIGELISAFLQRSRRLTIGDHLDLDYENLLEGGVKAVFRHFDLPYDHDDERDFLALRGIDAKDPGRAKPFRSTPSPSPVEWPILFAELNRSAIPAYETIRAQSSMLGRDFDRCVAW